MTATKGIVMLSKSMQLYEALNTYGHFATRPVGIKLAKADEKIIQKAKYPLEDIGNRLAVCQGMSLARTIGWTMVFRKQDHGCPLAPLFLGHTKPDIFLSGKAAGSYQDQDACAKVMESSFPRWPLNSIQQVWISPLNRCEFKPDLAVVYGNPAQILSLIQAANFRIGSGIKSISTGRAGCSTWIAGVVQSDECTYMMPGPGERVFAGTQDYEMSFALPYAKFDNLMAGLEYIGSKRAYKYPVPNLAILAEPKFSREYYAVDPQWQFDPK
ncbi:MAG: DUF169 domain-containing protein [Deltaproteobacteria bacterium]|nr:MAG: DUF169 domain-containing protein [Deltaproteobacteria bacterium]